MAAKIAKNKPSKLLRALLDERVLTLLWDLEILFGRLGIAPFFWII
jgi:hypothetical protein